MSVNFVFDAYSRDFPHVSSRTCTWYIRTCVLPGVTRFLCRCLLLYITSNVSGAAAVLKWKRWKQSWYTGRLSHNTQKVENYKQLKLPAALVPLLKCVVLPPLGRPPVTASNAELDFAVSHASWRVNPSFSKYAWKQAAAFLSFWPPKMSSFAGLRRFWCLFIEHTSMAMRRIGVPFVVRPDM